MNRRKIEIDGKQFEVWGSKPWTLIFLPNIPTPGHILIEEGATTQSDFFKNPQKYNALHRINPSGAKLAVLFAGASGYAMGDEIAAIINQKL